MSSILLVLGFLMLFVKSSLHIVDSNQLYIFTNIIGVILLLLFYRSDKRASFLKTLPFYAGLNIIFFLMRMNETSIIPILSSFYIGLHYLNFLFPIVTFLIVSSQLHINKGLKLMKVVLVLAILACTIYRWFMGLSMTLMAVIIVLELLTVATLLVHLRLLSKEEN